MKSAWIVLFAALCFQARADAQQGSAEPKADFGAITARGRALFEYDQAAARGTDAIVALKPDAKGLAHYVCTKTSSGWVVFVPRWDEAHDRLSVVYEARENAGRFTARKLDPPVPAGDELTARERAIETALADFPPPNRRYNIAVLPSSDHNLFVYLYPGQTEAVSYPIGGDIRYTVSWDGKGIVEKRKLHNTLLEYPLKPGQKSGYHTHDVTDVPEDTDVLYVLSRKPSMPEIVGTPNQLFTIDRQGNIETGRK